MSVGMPHSQNLFPLNYTNYQSHNKLLSMSLQLSLYMLFNIPNFDISYWFFPSVVAHFYGFDKNNGENGDIVCGTSVCIFMTSAAPLLSDDQVNQIAKYRQNRQLFIRLSKTIRHKIHKQCLLNICGTSFALNHLETGGGCTHIPTSCISTFAQKSRQNYFLKAMA